jgi:hypothetical protein
MTMFLPAKQVIRFRGRDGAARAAALATELHGRCKLRANTVELTQDTEFGPRLFHSTPPQLRTMFRQEDFR